MGRISTLIRSGGHPTRLLDASDQKSESEIEIWHRMNWSRGLFRVTLIIALVPAAVAAFTGAKILFSPFQWDADVQTLELSTVAIAVIFGLYFLGLWTARGFNASKAVVSNSPTIVAANIRPDFLRLWSGKASKIVAGIGLVVATVVASIYLWTWWSDTRHRHAIETYSAYVGPERASIPILKKREDWKVRL